MIVITRKHSYFIEEKDLLTVELGSIIFDTKNNKMYTILTPGVLTEINSKSLLVETLEEFTKAIAAGGDIEIVKSIDAPTGFTIAADTTITNNNEIIILSGRLILSINFPFRLKILFSINLLN